MKNTQRGFIMPLLLALIAVLLVGGGVYVYENKKAEAPAAVVDTATQQSNQVQPTNTQNPPVTTQQNTSNALTAGWKTYTDPDNRFSLNYPSTLIINSEKSIRNQVDTVRFQLQTSTVIQIAIFNTNSRWPDLKSLVNDQYLMSKGGDTPAPVFKILLGGLKVQDVGGNSITGHVFVGQLNQGQFIVLTFKDENLIDQALSSFKLLTNPQTTGWKTYTNSQYGFELKYPPELKLSEKPGSTWVNVVLEKPNFQLTFFAGTRSIGGYIGYGTIWTKKISIGDKIADETLVKCEGDDVTLQIAYTKVENETRYDKFDSECFNKSLVVSFIPQIEAIAKTLKYSIASDSQTADWEIYTNTQYGFEFKYPAQFYIVSERPGNIQSGDIQFSLALDDNQFKGQDHPRKFTGISVYQKSSLGTFLSGLVEDTTGTKLNITRQEKISDNPVLYKIYIGNSGYFEAVAIKGNTYVYIVPGSGPTVDQIISIFKFAN